MSDVRDPATDQQLPVEGQADVHDYTVSRLPEYGLDPDVLAELTQALRGRIELGVRKYRRRLQSHNGRSALDDAWHEALDELHYLHQMALEGEPGMEPLIGWAVKVAASLAARRLLRK